MGDLQSIINYLLFYVEFNFCVKVLHILLLYTVNWVIRFILIKKFVKNIQYGYII